MKGAADTYGGRGLIADPIHQYILYTRQGGIPGEATEQDLIDTPWVQRLRRIPQLQSARWVFPAAEHSRFQHSLGAMHLAGRLAQHLYPSFRAVIPTGRRRPSSRSCCGWPACCTTWGTGPSATSSTTTSSSITT